MNEHTKQVIKENILASIEVLKKEMLSRKEIKGLTIDETLEKLTSITFEKINQNNNEISVEEVKEVINEEFKYTEFMINDYEIQEKIRKSFNKAVAEMEENIDKYKRKLTHSLSSINNIYENIREFVLREINELMSSNKIFDKSDLFQYNAVESYDYTSITRVYVVSKEEMLEINKNRLRYNYESAKYIVSGLLNNVKKCEEYTIKLYPVWKSASDFDNFTYEVKYNGQLIKSDELKCIAIYNSMYLSLMCKGVFYDIKDFWNYTLYQEYNINDKTKEALFNLGCYTITLLGEHHNDIIEKIMFMLYPKLEYIEARKIYYNSYETQVMTIEQIVDAVQFLVYEHQNKNCCLLLDITSDLDVRLTHIYQVLPKLTSTFSELINNNKIRILDEPVYVIRLPELVLNGSDIEYCNRMLEVADKCNIPAYARLKGFNYYKYFYIEIEKEVREVVDKTLVEKDKAIAKMKIFNQDMSNIDNDWVTSLIERDIRQLLIDKGIVKVIE